MEEKSNRLGQIIVLGITALMGYGIVRHHSNRPAHDREPLHTEVVLGNNQHILRLDEMATRNESLTLPLPESVASEGGIKNPIVLAWSSASNPEIITDMRNGWIKYNGKVVIKWEGPQQRQEAAPLRDDLSPHIYGASLEDMSRGMPPIPLSLSATRAHPIHWQHQYHSVQDYDWLNEYLPENADLTLTPPPDVNEHSYEYRKWAYGNAFKTARLILNWKPENSGLYLPGYSQEHNLFPLALARLESASGGLPGPNSWIVNSSGFKGSFQQRENTSLPNSFTTKQGKWIGYVVNGKTIDSARKFLGDINVQMLAFVYQARSMQRALRNSLGNDEYLYNGFSYQFNSSGLLAASHLTGASKVPAMLKGHPSKDGNGTKNSFYAEHFSGYTLYPYHQLEKWQGKTSEHMLPGSRQTPSYEGKILASQRHERHWQNYTRSNETGGRSKL